LVKIIANRQCNKKRQATYAKREGACPKLGAFKYNDNLMDKNTMPNKGF
jgi:hypothetical protein